MWVARRFSVLIFGLVLISFASMSFAQGDCDKGGIAGCSRTIQVDGLTGNVTRTFDVVRPGGRVTVQVCPADLISYEYKIEALEATELKEGFPIVGVGTVFQGTSGGPVPALGTSAVTDAQVTALQHADKDLLETYRSVREGLSTARDEIVETTSAVDNVAQSPFPAGWGCKAWPKDVLDLVSGDMAAGIPPFSARYNANLKTLKDHDKRLENLVATINDRNLEDQLQGRQTTPFRTDLKREAQALQGTIQTFVSRLDGARKMVERWARIIKLHPTPSIEQSFLMSQVSTRYTLGVKRKPITEESRQELPAGTDAAKVEPSVIATTTFENRALHRFNVSLGMAGVWRGESRDFEVVPSLKSDGTTAYHIREAKRDEEEFEAAAFLGIYFKPVDNFNPDRGAKWMVMMGTEISASPTDFFFGLGRDTPQGVILGFGITEYEGVSPGDGWKPNQEVPAITSGADMGKPRIATVPKERKDTVGAYAFVGFRPSIFKAFLDRRK